MDWLLTCEPGATRSWRSPKSLLAALEREAQARQLTQRQDRNTASAQEDWADSGSSGAREPAGGAAVSFLDVSR